MPGPAYPLPELAQDHAGSGQRTVESRYISIV